jgi:hypothetical protein
LENLIHNTTLDLPLVDIYYYEKKTLEK